MYREIVTKAVVGKGKIFNNNEAIVKVNNNPSKLLGCWIINHFYVCSLEGDKVVAKGKYDLHIWYGIDNDSDTIVHKQTIDYVEEFSLSMNKGESLSEENELVAKCLKYPTCTNLSLSDNNTICVKIEKELSLDVIGETKLKVKILSGEDDWGINNDDINNIDVDYLNK